MSAQSMSRRLDKVAGSGGSASFAEAMEAAGARAKAWLAAGNMGPVPFGPLPEPSPCAPRATHESHAAMVAARARVKRSRVH